MFPGGPERQPYSYSVPSPPIDCSKIPAQSSLADDCLKFQHRARPLLGQSASTARPELIHFSATLDIIHTRRSHPLHNQSSSITRPELATTRPELILYSTTQDIIPTCRSHPLHNHSFSITRPELVCYTRPELVCYTRPELIHYLY